MVQSSSEDDPIEEDPALATMDKDAKRRYMGRKEACERVMKALEKVK